MKAKDWLRSLSLLIGLPYYEQNKVFGDKNGTLIGTRDGYLVALGLGKTDDKRRSAVRLLLRYGKSANPASVQQNLKPAKGHFKDPKADATAAVTMRSYFFGKPQPESVAGDVQNLMAALKTTAPPLAGKCEECQRSEPAITLFNDMPGHYCASCQTQIRQRLNASAMDYEKLEANLPLGILYGAAAALSGSIVWGLVAYGLNRIFLYGAILIGVFVAKAVVKGMGKVTWPGRIAIGLCTIVSVLFGDAIFYALSVMKHMHVEFGPALRLVLAHFWEVEAKSGIASIIFALIGAGLIIFGTRPPEFKARFEPLGTPAPTEVRAAGEGG